jgi:hypothetical protein
MRGELLKRLRVERSPAIAKTGVEKEGSTVYYGKVEGYFSRIAESKRTSRP